MTEANESGAMDVAYVARLARLALTPEEAETFQRQLDHIVGYVRKIGELDVSGVEPTAHAAVLSNVFRPDEARHGIEHDVALGNAPRSADGQFLVPRIVE